MFSITLGGGAFRCYGNEILVSAQGPLVLGFRVWGLGVWGQGLTILENLFPGVWLTNYRLDNNQATKSDPRNKLNHCQGWCGLVWCSCYIYISHIFQTIPILLNPEKATEFY